MVKIIVKVLENDNLLMSNSTLQRDIGQIDRNYDSDIIFNIMRRPSILPPEIRNTTSSSSNMSQNKIARQNAQIVNNLANTSLSTEVEIARIIFVTFNCNIG